MTMFRTREKKSKMSFCFIIFFAVIIQMNISFAASSHTTKGGISDD